MSETTHSIYCSANGCPQLGVRSSSATGGSDWYCSMHYGCRPGTAHTITAELQRLGWLVKIAQGVRANGGGKGWDKIERAMEKEIKLNQSGHLLRGNESLTKWLLRLDDTLVLACNEAVNAQHPLDLEPQQPAA